MNYDYKCRECDIVKEVTHGMNESPSIVCDKCGQAISKVISGGAGVIYRGKSGFRSTKEAGKNWGWSKNRPDPRQGHRLTAEERRAIEDKVVNKQLEKWSKVDKGEGINKAISKIIRHDGKKLK